MSLITPGAEVLDVFCYQGVWGMAALKAGARACDFVDASMAACERVEAALRANGLPDSEIHNGDAFDVLTGAQARRAGASTRWSAIRPPSPSPRST